MANLDSAGLEITWDWSNEQYHVTGHVTFVFGGTRYRLALDQFVTVPHEYANVADQVEHVFIDIAGQLGKLNNAQLTLEADKVQTYL